jgi:hypothetical protein
MILGFFAGCNGALAEDEHIFTSGWNSGGGDKYSDLSVKTDEQLKGMFFGSGANGDWSSGDVIVMSNRTRGKHMNAVIVGDGFIREDLQNDGVWETKGIQIAKYFLNGMVIRDFKEYWNVYILFTESQDRYYPADPGQGPNTAFKPGGGRSHHPNWDILAAKVKAIPQLPSGEHYEVMYINNYDHVQWEAISYGVAIGSMDSNKTWSAHEFTGHVFAGLADEYLSESSPVSNYNHKNGTNLNINEYGFPQNDLGVTWPDAELPLVSGGTRVVTTDWTFPGTTMGAGPQIWPDKDWQHWPSWVVFMGLPGHYDWIMNTARGKDGYRWAPSPGTNVMCQPPYAVEPYFNTISRFAIWMRIKERSGEHPIDWFFVPQPAPYTHKFPSEAALKEFIAYDAINPHA